MRKYLAFILLLTIAVCQNGGSPNQGVLTPNCAVQADKYGFVELQAFAGYYIDSSDQGPNYGGVYFYCYNTNVTATIGNANYLMDQQLNCNYTKMVQLSSGTYNVSYTAVYPDLAPQQSQCSLVVSLAQTMNLVVYGLKNGDTFRPGSTVHVEAVAVMSPGYNVDAKIGAKLMSGTTVIKDINLTSDVLGTKAGDILLNVSEGNYTIRLAANYQRFSVQKDFSIIVTAQQISNVTVSGLNVIVLEPENIVYPANSNLNLQVELQDEDQQVVSGATVKADVYNGEDKVGTVQLQSTAWYYSGSFMFSDVGEYRVVYTATKGYSSSASSVSFLIGNASGISSDLNFSAKILNPSSSVYLRDSTIAARVKVTKFGEPVSNASVKLYLEGREILMEYDTFGQYTAPIGPLSEGVYELKAVATQDELVSQDKITFMISRHILNIDTVSPYHNQEFELKKGDALKVKAIVLDEERDIVPGALVVAKIMEPDGKTLQMQLFQDATTGEYSSTLYLNELNGNYRLTVEASKSGYIPATKDSQFDVTFQKEQVQIFSQWITTENLLTIILVVAIVILVAAVLTAVF